MCNCIQDTEKALKEHLINNDPKFKDIKDFEVDLLNKAYMVNSGKTELTLPIEITWKHTAKSGRVSTKKKTMNLQMGYCPFCGEKLKIEGDKND